MSKTFSRAEPARAAAEPHPRIGVPLPASSRSLDLVNPLQGARSHRAFSRGNTYPAVDVPRGLAYWTPQTDDGLFVFDRRQAQPTGVRATHSPSPWSVDSGHFDVSATLRPLLPTPMARALASHQDRARPAPHRFEAERVCEAIRPGVTATTHRGLVRIRFPPAVEEAFVAVQAGVGTAELASSARTDADGTGLSGTSRANHGGTVGDSGCRWVVTLGGAEVLGSGTLTPSGLTPDRTRVEHPGAGAFLRVRDRGGEVVLRIGTSFIDAEHAADPLRREVEGLGFAEVADETADPWLAGSGFMRPRRSDGSWVEPETESDRGCAYLEGGPW